MMIKAVVKINKQISDQTMREFLDEVVKITGKAWYEEKRVIENGHLKAVNLYKYDDVGRPFIETLHIFKDMDSVSRVFDSEESKIKVEELKKNGFEWSLKTYEISPILEKIYLEEIGFMPSLAKIKSVPEKLDEITIK